MQHTVGIDPVERLVRERQGPQVRLHDVGGRPMANPSRRGPTPILAQLDADDLDVRTFGMIRQVDAVSAPGIHHQAAGPIQSERRRHLLEVIRLQLAVRLRPRAVPQVAKAGRRTYDRGFGRLSSISHQPRNAVENPKGAPARDAHQSSLRHLELGAGVTRLRLTRDSRKGTESRARLNLIRDPRNAIELGLEQVQRTAARRTPDEFEQAQLQRSTPPFADIA